MEDRTRYQIEYSRKRVVLNPLYDVLDTWLEKARRLWDTVLHILSRDYLDGGAVV